MQPQYFLNVRSYQANFEIRLNDVLVESDYDNRNMTYSVPVNHWLRRDRNVLSFRLLPYDGESSLRLNARLELAIERGLQPPGGGDMEVRDHYVLATQDVSGQFDDPVPAFVHTAGFAIAESLYLPWESGEEIQLREADLRSLTQSYTRLAGFIAAKDVEGFIEATRPKIADCARALHWDLEEDLRFSREHYGEVFGKPGYVAWPLSAQQLLPVVEGGGRLVSFRNEKRQPPLLMYNEEEGTCIFFDLRFYRPAGSREFVVIR